MKFQVVIDTAESLLKPLEQWAEWYRSSIQDLHVWYIQLVRCVSVSSFHAASA